MLSFLFGASFEGKTKIVHEDVSNIVKKLESQRSLTKSFVDRLEGWVGNFQRNFFRMELNWDLRKNYQIARERLYEMEDQFDELNVNYRHAKLLLDDFMYQAKNPGFNPDVWVSENSATLEQVRTVSEQTFVTDFDKWMRDRIAATVDKVIPDVYGLKDGFLPQPGGEEGVGKPDFELPAYFLQSAAAIVSTATISALSAFVTLDFLQRNLGAHSPDARIGRQGHYRKKPLALDFHEPAAFYGGNYGAGCWPQAFPDHQGLPMY